jgi:hypothetical protein
MANTPTLTVRIPPELRERIEAEAEREERTTSNMLLRLVSEALAARDRKDSRKIK